MCGEAVDDSLAPLFPMANLFPIGLLQVKWLNNFLLLCSNVVFSCNEMGVLNIYINDINLDNNFDADDPDTIILIRLLACILNLKNAKNFKKR